MATKKKKKGKVPKGAKRTGVSKVAILAAENAHKQTPKKKVNKLTKKVSKRITRRGTWTTPEVTEENKQIALQAIREKLSIQHACDQIGLSRTAFYSWMKKDPDFAAAVVDAQEGACDVLEECLMDRAKDRKNLGGVTSAIFLLKGRRSQIYHDRTHQVLTGPGGGPVQISSWVDLVRLADQAGNEKGEKQ